MKAPCLYHHRVREGFFKLDQIPSEVVANVFKYLPTLDIGRMMAVCKGFNQILSTNPSLWRIVDLDKETPNKSAFKIIKIFASRSRNTLVAIKSRENSHLTDLDGLISILKDSKATLRRLDLELYESWPAWDPQPMMIFFQSFPVIERLNLTSNILPEAEEQMPGVLTMFATDYLYNERIWSQEEVAQLASARYLHMNDKGCDEENGLLHPVLQACRSNLKHLTIGPFIGTIPLPFDLPKLSSLVFISRYDDSRKLFTAPIPSLEHLEGPPVVIDSLSSGQLQSISFRLEHDDWGGEVDQRFISVEKMIRMVRGSSSTLRSIKLKTGREGKFGIDPFLRTLKVDHLLPLCPLLTALYISKEQNFNLKLLAEVMVSRNFAAKGWKFEGEVGDVEDRRCSRLVLHLDVSHIREFKRSEKGVLSRCPSWMAKRAGRTEVKEWDGL